MRLFSRRPAPTVDPAAALARQLLFETREELDRADRKAQILFAAAGIGISAVLGGIASGDWSPFDMPGWASVAWVVGAAILLFGLLLLALAIFPRIRHTDPHGKVAYFGHVAHYRNANALYAALDVAATERDDRTLDQLLTLAKIVERKYSLISWGLWLVGAGFLIGLVTAMLGAFVG